MAEAEQPHVSFEDDLELIRPEEVPEGTPPEEVKEGYGAEKHYLQQEARRTALRDFKRHVEDRRKYTTRIFRLLVVWMVVVLVILILDGLHIPLLTPIASFDLPESVLLALIGSTTANVIGLFVIVAKHLYPPKG